MVMSFVLSFFPRGVLDEILNLIESVSEDFPSYFYFSGEEDKHEYIGYGFLVHNDIESAVVGCRPVSSRLISIRLSAASFNITIIQVYVLTSGHDDSEVDHFYQQFQETIDQTLNIFP